MCDDLFTVDFPGVQGRGFAWRSPALRVESVLVRIATEGAIGEPADRATLTLWDGFDVCS